MKHSVPCTHEPCGREEKALLVGYGAVCAEIVAEAWWAAPCGRGHSTPRRAATRALPGTPSGAFGFSDILPYAHGAHRKV